MSLDLAIRSMLKEVVREVVREEMAPTSRAGSAEFLTYAQAGELANLSPSTIKRWVGRGLLNAYGQGRAKRVRIEEVRTCMAADPSARKPAPATPNDKVRSILAGLKGSR